MVRRLSQVFAVLPEEVRETVDLYLDGKIEQWYSLPSRCGGALGNPTR
jgi:hypothetical protein